MMPAGRWFVAALLGCGLLTACGSDRVPPAAFESRLVERDHLTVAEASCVRTFLYDAYDDRSIERLYERGLRGLQVDQWTEYVHSMAGCLFT